LVTGPTIRGRIYPGSDPGRGTRNLFNGESITQMIGWRARIGFLVHVAI